jgi:hypothetical protein
LELVSGRVLAPSLRGANYAMCDDSFWSSDIGIEAVKDEINACKEHKVESIEISHNGHSFENITNSCITIVNIVDPLISASMCGDLKIPFLEAIPSLRGNAKNIPPRNNFLFHQF